MVLIQTQEANTEQILKAKYTPFYYIWCMNCNFEKKVKDRVLSCPKCHNQLFEKRYLM